MKKIFSLFLLLAFALSVLSACGGPEVTLLDFIGTDDGTIDLSGQEIIFLGESDIDSGMIFDHIMENTTLYDCILERFDEINKRYNVEIVYDCLGDSDTYEQLFTASMVTGDCPADIIYGHGNSKLQTFAEAGYLYPFPEVQEFLDYEDSEKFGSAGILEGAMVNGVPYAVQPILWPGFQECFGFVILYNPTIVTMQGFPDFHEYYENETWTWDAYQPMIENFDAGIDENMYALSSRTSDFADMALRSNGVKYADYIDGVYQSDILSSKAVTAVQWMQDLYLNNDEVIHKADDWELAEFIDGRAMTALGVTPNIVSGDIQYRFESEFRIMPFPCGPDGVYGEWAQTTPAIRGLAIPSNNESPEINARIISDLCDPFEEFGGEAGLADYYAESVFFTPIDAEIYLAVGDHVRYNYGRSSVGMDSLTNKIESAYKSSSAMEILESMSSAMNTFVENEVRPNYENYIHEHLYNE